jgi:hypothetical protein
MRRGVWTALALAILLTGCQRPDRPDDPQRYTMESRAMEPTIVDGQRVTGRPVAGAGYEPRHGDVVVIRPLDEPYIAENAPLNLLDEGCRPRRFAPVAVALGELFLMDDHRATAEDSRCLGTVPVSAVVAVVDAPNPG